MGARENIKLPESLKFHKMKFILRMTILSVFSQFLLNLKFIFSGLTNYIHSP